MKLDLRVLRLAEDPADWLREHSAEEFEQLLDNAIPILEYGVRQIADRTLGTDALDRARIQPEIEDLIMEIPDLILRREAIRLAAIALQVQPESLFRRVAPPIVNRPAKEMTSTTNDDPLDRAGEEVLALALLRPDLAAPLLRQGLQSRALEGPLVLHDEDFSEEAHARLFAVLKEHAGEDLDGVLADERARPLMDQIGALAAKGERLYPSESSVREAWLRLAILSREQKKRQTPDYDQKELLRTEIQDLKQALISVSDRA